MVKVNDIALRKFNETVNLTEESLPEITASGVSKFITLPAVWPILKRTITKAIPVIGTGLSLYDAWNEALKGDWTDSAINVGLAGLSIGQLFGYVAGGAPGVAATTAEIAGSLYVIRGVLIRLYFEKIEGKDLSNFSDEDLEDYTDELIAELAKQLADMITNGIYDAATGASEEAESMEFTTPEYDAMGNVTGTTTTTPVSPSTGEQLPPLPKVPEKPEAPKLPASVIKSKADEISTSPGTAAVVPASVKTQSATKTQPQITPAVQRREVPVIPQGLNFNNVPFKDAWKSARSLAKKLDPENPGSYNFIWNGKPYQTNVKGEPSLPISKQRKLIDVGSSTLAEDTISKALRWFGKGAEDAANIAGDVAGAADNVGVALKSGQRAEDAENIAKELDTAIKAGDTVIAGILNDATNIITVNGNKYAKYYDPMRDTWKWVDLQKASAGGKRSIGFVDDAVSKQLDDALAAETKAAGAATDATKTADDAAATNAQQTTSAQTTGTKLTPEAAKLLQKKAIDKWTVEELASFGFKTEDLPLLRELQKLNPALIATNDMIVKMPWYKSLAKSLGSGVTGSNLIMALCFNVDAVYDAIIQLVNLDPSDPNFYSNSLRILTELSKEVGWSFASLVLSNAIVNKILRPVGITKNNWIARMVNGLVTSYVSSSYVEPTMDQMLKSVNSVLFPNASNSSTSSNTPPNTTAPGSTTPGTATPNTTTPGTATPEQPATSDGDIKSNPIYKNAYNMAISNGIKPAAADRYARRAVQVGGLDESYKGNGREIVALAWLYKQLNEQKTPANIIKINKHIKLLSERIKNIRNAEQVAYTLLESSALDEENQTDNFMANITAAIAANTKGDKTGAQKALDAAKQSQPATAQDQINQKKVLDQMARTNPGLNIPNTNQNVTEDDPMGAGNDWATTANANDPNAKGTDLLAAYNEFAAKYPAAKFLLDIVPVTGTATSVIDASQDLYNGKYGQAALDILGAIPGFKIGKYISQGLAKAIKAANVTTKTANYANATANLASNELNETPNVGDRMMLELADGRVIVAPIAELRGNGIVIELDETGNQWLEESPEHHALKIGQGDGHPLSATAEIWNSMVDQLSSDTPDGWAEVFIRMQNQTGQPARVMPRLWSQIWRQQHNALGDSLTRVDMTNWAEEVGRAMDRSGLVESSLNPNNSAKLKKYLDPKDPAMLAVWMASRAGTKGVPVSKFAKDKAVQSGLPADHWWRKIKKLVQEGAVPTVPRLLAARDIEPLVHFEGDYYIVSHNDGKHLKYDLVKKVVATSDRKTPAYQHVDHLDTGLHRITKEQLRRLAGVAMEADKLADGEIDTPDLPDLLGVIAQVMGRKVRKHPDALSTTVKKSDMGYVVSNLLVRHLDGTEAQDLKNALHRAGYNVSKVIINPTTILVILKTTKTTPNTTAMITATPQPDVVGGLTEGRRDFNFDENDIARIAAMDDLDAAKRYAIKLITAKTRRPMTKEKIMWFTNSINDTKTVNRLVKMLYDMMLSGEGHGVIGDRYSTGKSSYRRQFDEESQRLDPKCWKGYRKQGTKIKDGVRVNNCVKVNEDMDEDEEELYYDAINHMDNLYYCLIEKKFREAATYLSELGHLYQEAGVYLSTAVDMVTDRKVKMHIEKLYGLLDNNKDNVIRGILQMIKQYGTSGNEIDNLISVLDDFGVEWPELDAVSNAVAKSLGSDNIAEAEYKGKSVPLNKPIRTSPSEGGKFKVYVKDPKTGNIKMVRFGDTTGLTIKRDDPERRKNFRARHHCSTAKDKTSARYWSCKLWSKKPVSQILKGK